jgi:putative ABC transport system substrate-binding protein
MDRRTFIAGTLALGLLAAPFAAEAQQAGRVARIGYLSSGTATANALLHKAFIEGLREHGWTDGQNIAIEYRWDMTGGSALDALADDLARLETDLIVVSGAPAALAAQQATTTMPIVMVGVSDPVTLGLVPSLARPGGNITGLTTVNIELAGKRVGLLKELIPKVSRVAILWDEANPTAEFNVKETEAAAASVGLTPQVFAVRGPNEFSRAFSAMSKEHVGALLVGPSPLFFGQRRRLADLAVEHRLPTVFTLGEYTQAGGLVAYGPHYPDLFRRAASFVDRILKGAKPAELPVEQPTKFELIINLKTAKALGLTIPPSVLARADDVIQ